MEFLKKMMVPTNSKVTASGMILDAASTTTQGRRETSKVEEVLLRGGQSTLEEGSVAELEGHLHVDTPKEVERAVRKLQNER